MKTGRMKKEGWWRKVLSILQCQTETRAVTRPGIRTVATGRIIALLTSWLASKTRAAAAYLPRRVVRLAEKRRKNLEEKNPPSGRILHGPVHKALAKPKLAVRMDDAYVTVKKTGSEPTIGDQLEFEHPAVFKWKIRI